MNKRKKMVEEEEKDKMKNRSRTNRRGDEIERDETRR